MQISKHKMRYVYTCLDKFGIKDLPWFIQSNMEFRVHINKPVWFRGFHKNTKIFPGLGLWKFAAEMYKLNKTVQQRACHPDTCRGGEGVVHNSQPCPHSFSLSSSFIFSPLPLHSPSSHPISSTLPPPSFLPYPPPSFLPYSSLLLPYPPPHFALSTP